MGLIGKNYLKKVYNSGGISFEQMESNLKRAGASNKDLEDILGVTILPSKANRTTEVSYSPPVQQRQVVSQSMPQQVAQQSVTPAPAPAKIDWQNKSIDEMASILGLENYKYADILNLYNNTTNKKFDELDTQTKRTQADNLRALEGSYDTYLNQLRQDRANAIGNGITKGASAAMQLATMYANADTISKDQQAMHDVLFDLNQQRGTALETNATTAMTDRRAIEQYLGTLRGTYEANSVNELAAKLAANAQVESARTQANATVKAAGIGASTATAAQDKVLQYYVDAANGNYQTGLANYLAQLERDSRTNEIVAKYQITNNK